jgi:cytochrome d ubiquinol oxidase subunit II
VKLTGFRFSGGPFDWATGYGLVVAAGLIAGYAFLGAAWLVWRTSDDLQAKARRWAWIAGAATAALLAVISVLTLFVQARVAARWGFTGTGFDLDRLAPRLPIPLLGLAGLAIAAYGLRRGPDPLPFAGAYLVFVSGYLGLAAGLAPYVAPYALTFRQAASADNALGLMLVGVAILLPVILGYTVWVYWLFRGKVASDADYH